MTAITESRCELQGVMGHEFSHILKGDRRLNLHILVLSSAS
jgi:Zn-dependent protease with chaperone function